MRSSSGIAAMETVGVLVVAGGVSSQEYTEISGSYTLASRNIVDPAPGEKRDRAAFFFNSDTAKSIYL